METRTYPLPKGRRDPLPKPRVNGRGWPRVFSVHRAVLLSLSLAAVVFAVDLCLPLGVASAVPYTFVVLLALKAPARRFALAVAVLCCALTIAKVVLFPERGSTELWKVVANRGLALFAVGMTAFLGMKRRESEEECRHAEERTQLHLADLARLASLKTAGQLAAGLAHELNQPLTAISLQSEVASQLARNGGLHNPAALQAALDDITEQSQRAASIVRALRGMVQKAEPRRSPADLNALVRDVVRLIDPEARRTGVTLRLQLHDAPLPVLCDSIQLEQVLFNLLRNALEAVADVERRLVQVKTGVKGEDCLTVAVRDTGMGLRPEELDYVFERFYTTKPNGLGMGLAISRALVEAHGGHLWAVPNPDGGATFAFTLPRARRT